MCFLKCHFNLPGQSVKDMKFYDLEKVKSGDITYRKEILNSPETRQGRPR